MNTPISFAPQYHELTEKDGKDVWVPMYNPARECVSEECARLQSAGASVDNQAWRRPALPKRENTTSDWLVLGFVYGSTMVGWLLTLIKPFEHVLAENFVIRELAGMAIVGAGIMLFTQPFVSKKARPGAANL